MADLSLPQVLDALSGLAPTLRGEGEGELSLSSVVEDSRLVTPGALFVVRRGERHDGRAFVAVAEERGALALLTSSELSESDLPQIVVEDLPTALGRLAQRFAGDPSHELFVLGITGTNGKTTTSCLVEQALTRLGRAPARLGTLGFFIRGRLVAETLTTPSAVDLAEQFRTARQEGASEIVMEVSSHALAQGRVAGVRFAAAGLTNLTQDHLDFHGSMADYARTKSRLFFEHAPEVAVVNQADQLGQDIARRFAEGEGRGSRLISYSARGEADIGVQHVEFGPSGLVAELSIFGQRQSLRSPLLGAHNLENLLLALGLLLALEVPVSEALEALAEVESARGRLERVSSDRDDVQVLVDYAHTPDALERALLALREIGARPLVCVFGCGGDRDRSKRPVMGKIAAELADQVTVTSDNPRSEAPEAIVEQILGGMNRTDIVVELDRRSAIFDAVLGAAAGATLLVAGKGHETYQIVESQRLPFDDAEVARQALEVRRARGS